MIPELLMPAGSLDKLKVAALYGANAIYVGGQKFGLRSRADNFTQDELREGITWAHQRGVKVYVVLNAFLHDSELDELPAFVTFLEEIGADAVIVSDLGVLSQVREYSTLPVHLSTQASCLNIPAARLWKNQGVKRIIVGRELSIEQASLIKREVQVEIEMFVHGSLCSAYSGNCTISNYTSGRDSNRGGCAHSCRFQYALDFPQSEHSHSFHSSHSQEVYFMNSKDLQTLSLLPRYIELGIDSLKVEGRMKGHHYLGTVAKVYSEAIQKYARKKRWEGEDLQWWESELKALPHRGTTEGSALYKAGADSINREKDIEKEEDSVVVGHVVEKKGEQLIVEVRSAFHLGEQLELMPFHGRTQLFVPQKILSLGNLPVEKTRPNTLIKIPLMTEIAEAESWNLIKKRKCS